MLVAHKETWLKLLHPQIDIAQNGQEDQLWALYQVLKINGLQKKNMRKTE
jgi:hypothetical protein